MQEGNGVPETAAQIVRRVRGTQTLDAFATELGTSRQRVIEWEKGRGYPSEKYAVVLAARAGVDASEIMRPAETPIEEAMTDLADAIAELRSKIVDPPASATDPTADLLEGVEGAIAELARDVRLGFARIGRRLDALDQRLPDAAPQAPPVTRRRGRGAPPEQAAK